MCRIWLRTESNGNPALRSCGSCSGSGSSHLLCRVFFHAVEACRDKATGCICDARLARGVVIVAMRLCPSLKLSSPASLAYVANICHPPLEPCLFATRGVWLLEAGGCLIIFEAREVDSWLCCSSWGFEARLGAGRYHSPEINDSG